MNDKTEPIRCVWGEDLGLESGMVRLVDYSDRWPEAFGAMRAEVVEAIGGYGHVETEHIGSTSVPGFTSKPMIDLMTGIERIEDFEPCIAPLERLGYVYKGEFGLPGRQFFVLNDPATAHLHLVQHNGHFWRLNVFFRDLLRNDEAARERYLTVKRELAEKYANSRPDYTKGKDTIIKTLLREAGWTED